MWVVNILVERYPLFLFFSLGLTISTLTNFFTWENLTHTQKKKKKHKLKNPSNVDKSISDFISQSCPCIFQTGVGEHFPNQKKKKKALKPTALFRTGQRYPLPISCYLPSSCVPHQTSTHALCLSHPVYLTPLSDSLFHQSWYQYSPSYS